MAASAEDVRALAERLIAMERAVAEQQQRAQQAEEALTALRQGQVGPQANGAAPPHRTAQQGIVDTKLMGKPSNFDGRESSWRSFKFQFTGYCGAIDPRLKALLDLVSLTDQPGLYTVSLDPE